MTINRQICQLCLWLKKLKQTNKIEAKETLTDNGMFLQNKRHQVHTAALSYERNTKTDLKT